MSKVAALIALAAVTMLARPVRGRPEIQDAARCGPGETLVTAIDTVRRVPFTVGERLQYSVTFRAKFVPVHVGSGEMRIVARDTMRGTQLWKATLMVSGGTWKLSVHDTTTSWFDSVTFNSHRFIQHLHDPGYHASRDTHVFPERRAFRTNADSEMTSVADPLDDVSLVYFVRTLPLAPGQCYVLHRYFKPGGNPVVLHVVRRDRDVEVPAGKFNTIVVRPEITTTGIFSKDGHAELWLSDDSARVVVQLKSGLSFGSINLFLSHIGKAPGG